MSGAGDDRPPPAVPSVRTALLLVLAALAAAAGLLVVVDADGWAGSRGVARVDLHARRPRHRRRVHPSRRSARPRGGGRGPLARDRDDDLRRDPARARRSGRAGDVASFVALARAGYWTDSVCHRLTTRQAPTGFLQCGDPTGTGPRRPRLRPPPREPAVGRPVRARHGRHGARRRRHGTQPASSSWCTATSPCPPAAPVYTVFGRVVEGQEVIDHIAARGGEDTRPDGPPFTSISILTVTVDRD